MNQLHCVIFLENSVPAFRIRDELIDSLAQRCPRYAFERVMTVDGLAKALTKADILITWKMETAWYDLAPRLRVLFTPAAGRDWVAQDPRGVVRIVHGSFHGAIMAETLVAMVLHFNRRIDRAVRLQRDHCWDRLAFSDAPRLAAQHVVILGYGAIGRRCARALKALGCGTITGVRRHTERSELDKDADRIATMQDLLQILPLADHVVAILPGGPETSGIITADHFSRMKSSAYFFNLGRGNCCDEDVLVDALRREVIAGAGLDVFTHEPLSSGSGLWDLPNVLILPHASAMGPDYMRLYMDQVAGWIHELP